MPLFGWMFGGSAELGPTQRKHAQHTPTRENETRKRTASNYPSSWGVEVGGKEDVVV